MMPKRLSGNPWQSAPVARGQLQVQVVQDGDADDHVHRLVFERHVVGRADDELDPLGAAVDKRIDM